MLAVVTISTPSFTATVLIPLSPKYTGTSPPPLPSPSFAGMVVSYYTSTGNQFSGLISGSPFDTSIVNVSNPTYPANFASFKYNSGVRHNFGYNTVSSHTLTVRWRQMCVFHDPESAGPTELCPCD